MNRKKKIWITVSCLITVLCAMVTGTLAWLMDETDPIVNTFTPSNIEVRLVEEFNTDSNDDSTNDKWIGQLIPGTTLEKKATVEVVNDIDCWVFLQAKKDNNLDAFIEWHIADGWNLLEQTDEYNIYYREVAGNADNKSFDVVKDNKVTVRVTVNKELMNTLTSEEVYPKLTFTAYAAQRAGLATAQDAWNAIYGTPKEE